MPRFPLPGLLNAALLLAAASWTYGAPIAEIPRLPFGIDAQASSEKVVITLDFVSAKTGAGTQRITLRGDGAVRLDFARSFQDKRPKSLERNCGPAAKTVRHCLSGRIGLEFTGKKGIFMGSGS